MTYKNYKIVGGYPQYDIWELDDNGNATDLMEEWDRGQDATFIQIWTYNKEDEYWSWDGDFGDEEYDTIDEAKSAIDDFVKAKA